MWAMAEIGWYMGVIIIVVGAIGFFVNEELFDRLNDIAPEGCLFGSHEGDGALFGFWTVEDDDDSD